MDDSEHPPVESSVSIPAPPVALAATVVWPTQPAGVVLFAHGSGSSRFSPRNRYVAEFLQQHHFTTILLDLLTPQEEAQDLRSGQWRFDIDLLAARLVHAIDWIRTEPRSASLPIGLFGASTGAAAALIAAAERPHSIAAVVSRGGRPDLAGRALDHVKAPTLLIVGSHDLAVVDLNREALARLACEKKLELVPGATHLFEEPGALLQVARHAADWFDRFLLQPGATRAA